MLIVPPGFVQAATFDQIREAWVRHAKAVRTLEYVVDRERTEVLVIQGPEDPFSSPTDKNVRGPMRLMAEVRFAVAGRQIACARSGKLGWNSEKQAARVGTHRACFDGTKSVVLLPGEHYSMGQIQPGVIAQLNRAFDLDALWLSYSPIRYFEAYRELNLKRTSITNGRFAWDGHELIELTVPFRGRQERVTRLYVDPSHGFRIARFLSLYKGVERREMNLSYAADPRDDWVLSSWRTAYYDDATSPTLIDNCVVRSCRVNEPIDDSTFRIEFPVGTQFTQDGNYFVQGPKGKRIQIKREDYGHIPPVGED